MNEYKRQWMMTNAAINHVQVMDPSGTEREYSRQDLVVDYIQRQGLEIPITFLASRASNVLKKSSRLAVQRIGRVGARVLPGVGYVLMIRDFLDFYEFVTQD